MVALALAASLAQAFTASASSTLQHKDAKRYAAANAIDGDPGTAWVEGAKGIGKGETLTVRFAKATPIDGLVVVAGYARSAKTLTDNGVPTKLAVLLDGKPAGAFPLYFARTRPANPDKEKGCRIAGAPANLAPRLLIFKQRSPPVQAIALRIADAEQVGKFDETAISEAQPIFAGAPLRIGGVSYRAAADALISLRAGTAANLPLSGEVPVDALAEFPASVGDLHPGEAIEPWLRKSGVYDTASGAEAWLRAFSGSVLGGATAALDGGKRLIGPLAWSHGDGQWVEVFPEMDLNAQGRIVALKRPLHIDAVPGCRETLP
jgi:hypothetical protein